MNAFDVFLEEINKTNKTKRICWFYHFTDKSNLPSIEKAGLLSKGSMNRMGMSYHSSGSAQSRESDRVSGVEDYVSLSFTDDHPMRDAVLREKRVNKLVTIKVHRHILAFDEIRFCPEMANTRGAEFFKLEESIKEGMVDFEVLYDDTYLPDPERLKRVKCCELLIPNCVPPNFLYF